MVTNIHLPEPYRRFTDTYPEIAERYRALGEACGEWGSLDDKTQHLLKLAITIGAGLEGATHSHTRRALEKGATPEEIRAVVLLALTTIGFPSMMAAMTWVEDVLSAQ